MAWLRVSDPKMTTRHRCQMTSIPSDALAIAMTTSRNIIATAEDCTDLGCDSVTGAGRELVGKGFQRLTVKTAPVHPVNEAARYRVASRADRLN